MPRSPGPSDDPKMVWLRKWKNTRDHHLSLRDYVGPFRVGPAGYRQKDVERLRENFEALARFCASPGADLEDRIGPLLENAHRPELIFRGRPDQFRISAFDRETGKAVAHMSPTLGTYCDEAARGNGITSEFHWLVHAAGSKTYIVADFSRAGFYARVKAHGLILNRLSPGMGPIPAEALEGYSPAPGGGWSLDARPDPDAWNESWGIPPLIVKVQPIPLEEPLSGDEAPPPEPEDEGPQP